MRPHVQLPNLQPNRDKKKLKTSSPEFSANSVGRTRLPEESQLVPVGKACSSLPLPRYSCSAPRVPGISIQFTDSSRVLHCCRKWI